MYVDIEWVKAHLPVRDNNSNKGSFGKLFSVIGSERYRGAARLCLEAALRGGAGYVYLAADLELCREFSATFPEVIYEPLCGGLRGENNEKILNSARAASAIVVGCGSGTSRGLYELCRGLILSDGGTLILDADAINSIAAYCENPRELLASSPRKIILTPHPLEFSRLSGIPTEKINESREACARSFAKESKTVLLLKGNGTVITDGERVYINTTGSSALAKAGSGDTLAGLLASICAMRATDEITAASLAAFIHGMAGDNLAAEYSDYGVTPSDLPREMARVIGFLQKK